MSTLARLQEKYEKLVDKREARIAELEEALRSLVDKLDAVNAEITNLSVLAHVHGHRYTGPNDGEELKTARDLLGKAK